MIIRISSERCYQRSETIRGFLASCERVRRFRVERVVSAMLESTRCLWLLTGRFQGALLLSQNRPPAKGFLRWWAVRQKFSVCHFDGPEVADHKIPSRVRRVGR